MKHKGFIDALDVDETFLDSEIVFAYVVSWQRDISPSHLQRNPALVVISTTAWHLIKPQTTGRERDFLVSLV